MSSTSSAGNTAARMARLALLPYLVAGCFSAAAPAIAAETTAAATCTVAGMNWNNDPVFRSSLHHSEREQSIRAIACDVESIREFTVGDVKLGLKLGQLYHERVGGPKLNVKLVDITLVDASGARSVGRVFLGPDSIESQIIFNPQAKEIDGAFIMRLSPRHRWLFRLQDDKLTADLAFGWRDSIDSAFPGDARSGVNLSLDLDRMEGRIALRAIGKDPGQRLPSAYDDNQMVVAKLSWRDGWLVADSTSVVPRKPDEEPFLDLVNEADETVRKNAKGLPAGVEPCELSAWSADPDPKGLNVRAAPHADAKVLGIVPAPVKSPKTREAFGEDAIKAEFSVIGYSGGWFLIEKIKAPGVAYDIAYPRHLPPPFKGRGWVRARMTGGALAYSGLQPGQLYASPKADAGSSDAVSSAGTPISAGDSLKQIHACSGLWALVETMEGQRGWWRSICSNQAANCS